MIGDSAVRRMVVLLIAFYQRFISPYKGFCCASRAYYGDASCSGIISEIVARNGIIAGWKDIMGQFQRCRHAYAMLSKNSPPAAEDDEDSEADNEPKKKKSNWLECAFLPGACAGPDPSDCALGGAAEGVSSACGSVTDAAAGVCSCG